MNARQGLLKRYMALLKMEVEQTMAYRFSFFTSFLAQIVKTLVMLAVWIAVYQRRETVAGFSYSMMLTYLLISQSVNNVYGFMNDAERPISKKIRQGTIGFDLLKPVNFVTARLMENVGKTTLQLIFAVLMFLVFKLCMPSLALPQSPLMALLFAVSLVAGYLIMTFTSLISGLGTFWFMNDWGLRNAKNAIIQFFSGALVPLSMLPGWMQIVMNVLPFKGIVYVPTMIYMGQYDVASALGQIAVQLVWVVIMYALTRLTFGLAIKKISINGG